MSNIFYNKFKEKKNLKKKLCSIFHIDLAYYAVSRDVAKWEEGEYARFCLHRITSYSSLKIKSYCSYIQLKSPS